MRRCGVRLWVVGKRSSIQMCAIANPASPSSRMGDFDQTGLAIAIIGVWLAGRYSL